MWACRKQSIFNLIKLRTHLHTMNTLNTCYNIKFLNPLIFRYHEKFVSDFKSFLQIDDIIHVWWKSNYIYKRNCVRLHSRMQKSLITTTVKLLFCMKSCKYIYLKAFRERFWKSRKSIQGPQNLKTRLWMCLIKLIFVNCHLI